VTLQDILYFTACYIRLRITVQRCYGHLPTSILAASSWHLRRHTRHPRKDAIRGCRACRAISQFSLPLAYLTGRPAVCCNVYSAARLSMCRVVLQIPRARHARLVADKSLASSYHTRPTRPTRPISSWHVIDILGKMSRGCYEETASVEFKLKWAALYCMGAWSVMFYVKW